MSRTGGEKQGKKEGSRPQKGGRKPIINSSEEIIWALGSKGEGDAVTIHHTATDQPQFEVVNN